jgi:hypothetical protein
MRCFIRSSSLPGQATTMSTPARSAATCRFCGHLTDRLDLAHDARRPGESFISGDQDDVKGFGQCDIRGVVGSHRMAQRPNAAQQWPVRRAAKRQVLKICYRGIGSPSSHQPGSDMATPYRRDLEVNEFRGRDLFACEALPGAASGRTVVAERHSQNACVNDDHVLPERDSPPSRTTPCHPCVPRRAQEPLPKSAD